MTTAETLKIIDTALMAIIEMDDFDTWVEQLECIEPLRNLRNKLAEQIQKENTK